MISVDEPHIILAIAGRVQVDVSPRAGQAERALEPPLRRREGVRIAEASLRNARAGFNLLRHRVLAG